MPVVDLTYSQRAGILKELQATWKNQAPVFKATQDITIKPLSPTTLRKATYVWKESIPFPTRWEYGAGRTYQTFKDRYIELALTAYELSIPYNRYDAEDDQIGDLKSHVQSAARRYLQLPDKFLAEYFNNSATLLPSLANAYDGVGLFSDVDGDGSDRFDADGGNIITGSGVSTPAAIKHDLFIAQRRFLAFRDTAGQPIFDENDVKFANLHLIVPTSMNGVIQELSEAKYLHMDAASNTSESNIVAQTFSWQFNPYLTDTVDWFVAIRHPFWKGLTYRAPHTINQILAEISNSDHSRKYNEDCLYTDMRCAMGPWCPFVIIKINN